MGLRSVAGRARRWVRHPAEVAPAHIPTIEPPRTEPGDWRAENARRVEALRGRGVRIGRDCLVFTTEFSTEPYLVEIGDRVAVAGGVMFLTHDGAAFLLRRRRPEAQHFGRIVVGDDSFIGQNSTLLPGTRIGSDCVVGAGSVVRGAFPDNSVVAGNPARVVGRTSLLLEMLDASPDTIDTYALPSGARDEAIKRHFGLA